MKATDCPKHVAYLLNVTQSLYRLSYEAATNNVVRFLGLRSPQSEFLCHCNSNRDKKIASHVRASNKIAGFFWNGNENETVTLSLQRCRFLCSPAAAAAICGVIHVMGSEFGGDRANCLINIAVLCESIQNANSCSSFSQVTRFSIKVRFGMSQQAVL